MSTPTSGLLRAERAQQGHSALREGEEHKRVTQVTALLGSVTLLPGQEGQSREPRGPSGEDRVAKSSYLTWCERDSQPGFFSPRRQRPGLWAGPGHRPSSTL